ncbi:peptidoglycan DD-metalloendopeptidase family protein [Peribacillus tepidiphilus]|uniref:peptidoglycan DD-metalloendopeptidase family protein n=1 Tax=Peribacillus tepidiphilus TaxID=2652445 RepID=UPI0035B54B1A
MFHVRDRNFKRSTKTILKKAMIIILAATVITFHKGAAEEKKDLSTIYHVYLKDKYIGSISDKDAFDRLIERKMTEAKERYPSLSLQLDDDLKLIEESVFQPSVQNQKVLERLQADLSIDAVGYALEIEGTPVAYLPTKEAAVDAVKKFMLQYVTPEELANAQKRSEEQSTLPELTEPGLRIKNIRLSKELTISEAATEPSKLVTSDQALTLFNKGTLEEKIYKVREGDVLGSIASAHQLKTDELLALNPGLKEDSLLKIGQAINVLEAKPLLQVIVEKEVFKQEEIPFQIEVKEDASLPKGETRTKQKGVNGQKNVNVLIIETNGKQTAQHVQAENVTKEPVSQITLKGTKVIPSRGTGQLSWPAVGGYVSSKMGYRWGKMHKGIDIARPSNRTIKAADHGIVTFAGYDGGYGNKIVINHQNGMETVYAHLSSINVQVGQTVQAGSEIGVMGSTGHSTGVHLHFEVIKNGKLVNPLLYL